MTQNDERDNTEIQFWQNGPNVLVLCHIDVLLSMQNKGMHIGV